MNYYEIGNTRDIVISNSSLSEIDIEKGGSPRKFISFFEEDREFKNSQSLEFGTLLHTYIEDPKNFSIADFEKPSTKLMIDTIHYLHDQGYTVDNIYENRETLDNYEISVLGFAAYNAGYKVARNAKNDAWKGIPPFSSNDEKYLQYLTDSKGKIAVTKNNGEKLEQCKLSLNANQAVRKVWNYIPNEDEVVYNEVAIYFTININVNITKNTTAQVPIKIKCLLDKLVINTKTNTVLLIDLKTTSFSIYTYPTSFKSYKVYRQMALYKLAILIALSGRAEVKTKEGQPISFPRIDINKINFYNKLIVCETNNFYQSTIYNITDKWLKLGEKEYKSLITRVAWHIYNNEWLVSMEESKKSGELYLPDPETL